MRILVISTLILLLIGCNRKVDFPASLMEMNKPEYLLKDSLFWNKNESKHFKFYASKKVDEQLISTVSESQEKNILHIAKIMGINNIDTLSKINIWIFESDKEKYLKTQVKSSAHSLSEYWSGYYNKNNAAGGHEIGHLMSQHYWGYLENEKYSFILEEGFAFYVDEEFFFKIDFYDKAKKLIHNDEFKLSTILEINNNDDYRDKAIVCGAFDKYLITNYGIDKFSALWKNSNNDKLFYSIYNKSFSDLEKDFYAFIGNYKK